MNGSIGSEFREPASKERTQRIARQARNEEIRQLNSKAERHLKLAVEDFANAQWHTHVAAGYRGTASWLTALNNRIAAQEADQ